VPAPTRLANGCRYAWIFHRQLPSAPGGFFGAPEWRASGSGAAVAGLDGLWFDHASGRFLASTPDDPSLAVFSFAGPYGRLTQVGADRFTPNGSTSCLAYDSIRKAVYAGGVVSFFDLAAF
jgi:hypothetical protein